MIGDFLNNSNSIASDLPNSSLHLMTEWKILVYWLITTLHPGVTIVNTVFPNGNKANFRVKAIYSGKRSIHFARWWDKNLSKRWQT